MSKKWLVMAHVEFENKYRASEFLDRLKSAFEDDCADIKLTLVEMKE